MTSRTCQTFAGRGRPTAATLVALSVVGIVVIGGCYTIRVTTDVNPTFPFVGVRTYAWLPDPPGHTGDVALHNPLVDERVRSAIDRQLAARGLQRVPTGEADIHVTYYLGLETRVSWRMVTSSYQYQGGWFDHYATERTLREYEKGTLLIDVLAPANRRLVWRGTARARVRRESAPERRARQINDAVAKILAKLPPSG